MIVIKSAIRQFFETERQSLNDSNKSAIRQFLRLRGSH